MSNSILLKNPIMRNKMKASLNNPVGDLIEEIKEQDLGVEAGGTATLITTISPVIPTPFAKCGVVYTVSAECNGGKSCN
ncbi:MAG: hypothetical protein K0S41_2421 [Anaerocolumna sp.]|jgi:hypothetical protein|nr:hypothetical protein [Anaerocolumna sp.]